MNACAVWHLPMAGGTVLLITWRPDTDELTLFVLEGD